MMLINKYTTMWIEWFTIKISTKLQYTAHVGNEMSESVRVAYRGNGEKKQNKPSVEVFVGADDSTYR